MEVSVEPRGAGDVRPCGCGEARAAMARMVAERAARMKNGAAGTHTGAGGAAVPNAATGGPQRPEGPGHVFRSGADRIAAHAAVSRA